MEHGANSLTGSWSCGLWRRTTCSLTHRFLHYLQYSFQCLISRDSFNTIEFPSTRLSCVHTLRKEAQEIAHRYTCNSAGICAKNQRQIVPTEELCSRVTTASSVMGPTSCECIKAILDPRITANNSLHMVMELGNNRFGKAIYWYQNIPFTVMETVTEEGQSRHNSNNRIRESQ